MGQKLFAYKADGSNDGYYDNVISPLPAGKNAIAITDDQWQACIETPGYTVVLGALVAPAAPTAAQLLATAQTQQTAIVRASCQAQIVSGFTSSALGSIYSYPSTLSDQQNQATAALASLAPGLASTWTTALWCATSAGVWAMVDHTATEVQQVLSDNKAAIVAAQQKYATLAAAISAATTIAAVQAITWATATS